MRLSRHLYQEKEIKYSFIKSILYRTSLNECFFWIMEYYFSFGEQYTKQLIWEIYYDFFYSKNHNMKTFIENTTSYLTITKNLFSLPWNSLVFEMRLFYETNPLPTIIFKRIPKSKTQRVIECIKREDLHNICCYLVYCETVLCNEIIQYIGSKDIVWGTYTDKFHILLAEIIRYYTKKYDTSKTGDPNYLIHNEETMFKSVNHYDLSLTRLYKIHQDIGCFNLPRLSTTIESIYKNWELHCFHTPYWNKLFVKFGAKIQNGEVQFTDATLEEEFYEKYGYHIDEPSSRVNEDNCFPHIETKELSEFIEDLTGRKALFI